jgi:hypothetical protein
MCARGRARVVRGAAAGAMRSPAAACAQLAAEKAQVGVLERNISCLYRTARAEAERMRGRIAELDNQYVHVCGGAFWPNHGGRGARRRHERDARALRDAAERDAQLKRRIAELEHAHERR